MAGGQRRRGVSKYAHLLEEDETFRAWYRNVLRGSYTTGSAYLLRMGRLCDGLCHVTPKRIASMNKVELMTFVTNAISDLEEAGVSGGTINSYVKAIKSWGRFNGTKLDEKVSIPESEPKYADEVVPKPEEVQVLFDHSPLRVKAAVSLMGFSGLRPATIGDAEGTDGLKLGDLPEVEVRDSRVAFTRVPTLVVVRKRISKIRASFVTFAPALACEYLRQYLEDRLRLGEKLGPESAVVTVSEFNRKTRRS